MQPDEQKCPKHNRFLEFRRRDPDPGDPIFHETAGETWWECPEPGCGFRNCEVCGDSLSLPVANTEAFDLNAQVPDYVCQSCGTKFALVSGRLVRLK